MLEKAFSLEQVRNRLIDVSRGSYTDLAYNPVFRASALFYIYISANVTTKVAFLNYWKLKNSNPMIGLLLSVRDNEGSLVKRLHALVSSPTRGGPVL